MRLVNVESGRLEEFHSDTPSYAILSHTWGQDHEEISYRDMQQDEPPHRQAGDKLAGLRRQASSDGHRYAWIDTCCIDKSNSVELGEAINSMYRWYKESSICYVYLADVSARNGEVDLEQLHRSRWFTRGWTLQELLAPRSLRFYDCDWCPFGEKCELAGAIRSITGIPYGILLGFDDVSNASVAQRMSWAAKRVTKRKEDLAYCLLGIFDVMLPMIYGEEERAFIRLQEEIIKKTADDSILAWGMSFSPEDGVDTQKTDVSLFGNALATSPADFMHSGKIVRVENQQSTIDGLETARGCLPLCLRLLYTEIGQAFGFLNCRHKDRLEAVVGIPLLCITPGAAPREYIRPAGAKAILHVLPSEADSAPTRIRIRALLPSNKAALSPRKYGFQINRWSGSFATSLEIVDIYLEGQWDEYPAFLSTAIDIRHNGVRRAWYKVRQTTETLRDFVFALEFQTQQMEVHATCHLMVASRNTALDEIARAAYKSNEIIGSKVANNNSLTLEIKLAQDSPSSRLYVVVLEALTGSLQPMHALVDADNELKILMHTKSLSESFAESWSVDLKLTEFKKPLESEKQPQDQHFLNLLKEREAIRSRISGDIHSVQDLMTHSVDRQNRWHHSMLTSLCKDLQLKYQPSTDEVPKVARRAFIRAVVEGHIAAMEYLVANLNVDLAVEDSTGRGALALAVTVDNIPMLESLIRKGFVVNRSDSRGQAPLAIATLLGHNAALLLLLDEGASADVQIGDGRTPLDVVVKANQPTIVRALLEKGANVRGGLQYPPLSCLAARNEPPLALAARLGLTDIIACLLDHGADVNDRGLRCTPHKQTEGGFNEHCPALVLAAYMGHYDAINLLLSQKAYINASDANGQTSLLWAAKEGHDHIVKLLLQQGADTEMSDKVERATPLAFAVAHGHDQAVALLLDHGADIEAKDRQEETAISHSIRANSYSTLQLLLSRNANVNAAQSGEPPIFLAVRQANVEAVDLLIRYGARISTRNKSGQLPLQYVRNLYEYDRKRDQLVWRKYEKIIRILQTATIE